jgi:hypothetical protein
MRNSRKSFKETVNETLRLQLLSRQAARHFEPYKVRAKNLGLKPGYSFDKPWKLIEEIEGPDYR